MNFQNKLVWQLGSVHKIHIHLEALLRLPLFNNTGSEFFRTHFQNRLSKSPKQTQFLVLILWIYLFLCIFLWFTLTHFEMIILKNTIIVFFLVLCRAVFFMLDVLGSHVHQRMKRLICRPVRTFLYYIVYLYQYQQYFLSFIPSVDF